MSVELYGICGKINFAPTLSKILGKCEATENVLVAF